MTGAPRILFVADADPATGAEHALRCLTLAGALQSQGAACSFVAPPAVEDILAVFAPAAVRIAANGPDPHALFVAAQGAAFDAIVFDHGALREADHKAIARGCPALVIDDRADRPLGASLLLNPNPERRADDYEGLLPPGARTLFGPLHALVPPEFAALREGGLARRSQAVSRILVAMDMADGGQALTTVLDRLRSRAGGVEFDVVVAHGAPGLPGLERLARRDPRIVLHVDPQDMPALTAQAGMAVGVTNSAAWERCTLGLPTILAIARADQRPASHLMAELDAAMVVDLEAPDFQAAFDRALALLLRDGDLRASLAAASARVCDGLGAGRVATSLLQLIRDTRPQPESLVN